jgi:hypothetical protein
MCNVDTSVLGQVWVDPDEPMAFPVFNTKHVCKNFDQVREWAEKLQVRHRKTVTIMRAASEEVVHLEAD